ncbi:MAG: HAD family hydrolase [Candidatus Tectomicrobia bacterium]|uniref:HAD family hydrolase n=1 Tax=Tectimicrobiota bacterium TaxID=2528274 RepID=A0A938B3B5_UNCTE|nr:HAD family hydrolase [Candidatus Tectomicrobia bacterium]
MDIPHILALDFDGVLCDGMHEYFEASRLTYQRVWPEEPVPSDECFAAFRTLRPVIMTGWEMPVLLRAIVQGHSTATMLQDWETVRNTLVQPSSPEGKALGSTLTHTLDEVRRAWIAATPDDWLERNQPYCTLDTVRRLVTTPQRTVLVTTKEGEFARQILDHWDVHLADIQGKETGTHKCDNLRSLIAQYEAAHGQRPRLWFVEDRLETLQHVTTHPDLEDVGLFLATWGYNTPEVRASVSEHGRIRLLTLAQFQGGLENWH